MKCYQIIVGKTRGDWLIYDKIRGELGKFYIE